MCIEQKHKGFVRFPSLPPATKCSARKAAASLGTSGFSYLCPNREEAELELTRWFKICQKGLCGGRGTECGRLGQQQSSSPHEASRMTFGQSGTALLNVIPAKVKATEEDRDHLIDEPSYPHGSNARQSEELQTHTAATMLSLP